MLLFLTKLLIKFCEWTNRVVYITGSSGVGLDVYLVRYILFKNKYFSVYIHRFLRSDRDDLHNHPWNFMTLMIKGAYTEVLKGRDSDIVGYLRRHTRFNRLVFRKANDFHKIVLDKTYSLAELDECPITFFISSKRKQPWGFLKDGVFIPWKEYLKVDYNEYSKEVIEKLIQSNNNVVNN